MEKFINDLKEFMTKYQVEIYIELDGDTHCLLETMVIESKTDKIRIERSSSGSIDYDDLKQNDFKLIKKG